MPLPNADTAQIAAEKIRDYLLSKEHPLGRFKARFFAALGFAPERWQELETALRIQHLSQDAEPGATSVHGQRFTIRAMLSGQAGQAGMVVSVWFIRANETVPRFVTAYPGDRR